MIGDTIPAGATVATHFRSDATEPHMVVIASGGESPTPEGLATQRGGLVSLLTHSKGVSWPDHQGEATARAVLGAGGNVILAFRWARDASACLARLERERQA